ncbi:hypothetical protein L915_20118 [Phytophthora nicotianae]|nr:hypothetical protein L915_20118 [Phytophthora nicotianae]
MMEPMTTPPFDAREHAVLLEFLDNFHPSEIEHDEPLQYTQDSDFLLDVDDVEYNTAMDTNFGSRFS